MLQVSPLQPLLPVSKPLPLHFTPQHGGENGRSDWLFFCRHVTGSHEDVMWSLIHQFNDVPDFFMVLSPDFMASLTNSVRRRKWMLRLLRKRRAPPQEAHICTPPSLCCWLNTQERGAPSVCRDIIRCASWTYRVWEILNEPGCKDILDVTTWSATVLDCCSRATRITEVVHVWFFPEGFQHLHLLIYLWTMQVDKAWFSSGQ